MKIQIASFLNKKGIKNDLIRNVISMFIIRHTELYGDVIPFGVLMERLDANLNYVQLVEESERIKDTYFHKSIVGQYKGFDVNTIDMYFSESDLKNPQLLEAFIDILIHELTHVAYTIKVDENNFKKQEKHLFGTRELSLDGTTLLVEGNDIYMEAIINFISCRILDKTNNGSYMPETTSIFRLTQKIDEKKINQQCFLFK